MHYPPTKDQMFSCQKSYPTIWEARKYLGYFLDSAERSYKEGAESANKGLIYSEKEVASSV